MAGLTWTVPLAWCLAAFFLLGGVANLLGPAKIVEGFRRWGYPRWFHLFAGVAELVAAVLIVLPSTRTAGALMGGAIMLVAAGTVLLHREWSHAVAPLVVLVLTFALSWQ